MRYSGILFLLDFNSHSLILVSPTIIAWSLKPEGIALTKILVKRNTNSTPLFLKKAVPGMNQTIAKLWETIDIKNVSLSTCFAINLNQSLIKGARVCPLFPGGAFAFPNKIPTFPNFLRVIESQTNLKKSIKVEARAKHYAILAHKEEDIFIIIVAWWLSWFKKKKPLKIIWGFFFADIFPFSS